MEFQQDEHDFINELLGHAGLENLTTPGPAASEVMGFEEPFSSLDGAPSLDQDHSIQPYSRETPARQQELLQRQKNRDYGGFGGGFGSGLDAGFLIDEHLAQDRNRYGPTNGQREGLNESMFLQEQITDDQASKFAEDTISSSLGSSVATSDFLSPSSSFSMQTHQLDAVDSPSYSQYLSSSLRSPSNSLRQGSYLSTSLRTQSLNPRYSSVGSTTINTPGESSSTVPMSQEEKLRRRREFHNAVERRRRELIKQKVKELSKMIPPSLLNYNEHGKEVKANKGVILNRSVDYLDYLQQVLDIQDRKRQFLLKKVRELESYQQAVAAAASGDQKDVNARNTSSNSPEQILDHRMVLNAGENSSSTPSTTFQDDLHQFLSGDLIEAEDNAKLMFGAEGEGTTADFLLNFGK